MMHSHRSTSGRIPRVARLSFPVLLTVLAGSYSMTAHATDSAAAAGTSSTVTATPASVPAAAASAPLIQATDLVYQGAFRLPQGQFGGSSFSYGGSALAVNSARGSLFMVGHPWQQQVAEVTIPGAGTGVLSSLPTATVLQPFVDLSEGRMLSIGTSPSTDSPMVGGLLAYRGHLYESAYLYYDGTAGQTRSHFISGLDLSVSGDVSGPYQIGNYGLVTGQNTAGFVDGYMTPIPTAAGKQHWVVRCSQDSVASRSSAAPHSALPPSPSTRNNSARPRRFLLSRCSITRAATSCRIRAASASPT